MRLTRTTAATIAVSLLALTGPAIAAPGNAADAAAGRQWPGKPQQLRWQPCFEERTAETGVVFECTHIHVPLDYDRRNRRTIDVELARIPATDQAAKRGSILLNPGGPGGSGIDFLLGFGPFAGLVLSQEIPQQFDMIGFDPRGILRSTPIRCFTTLGDAEEIIPPFPYPLGREEIKILRNGDKKLAKACRRNYHAKRIGRHMSTANVARDMDEIRKAVGDRHLNYLGLSYGTFLGATYANLFPDRVGSVVVDGVLDPVAWVNLKKEVPFSTRLRSDEGAAETLAEFFSQCDAAAGDNCAFAPDSSARFDALMASLLESPRTIVDPETGESFTIGYRDVIGGVLGDLYNPFSYVDAAQILAALEAAPPDGTPAFGPTGLLADFHPDESYPNFVEGFPAVGCVDTTNPRSYRRYQRAALAAEAEFGYFGQIFTWISSPCILWPFKDRDRYEGPFTAATANPVLVIGNLYDPVTRYEGAQTLRGLLPNSALLTVDVPGHTSLGLSGCAGSVTAQYLLDPSFATSADGQTCPAEFNAFDIVAGPPSTTGEAAPEARTTAPNVATMKEVRAVLDDISGYAP